MIRNILRWSAYALVAIGLAILLVFTIASNWETIKDSFGNRASLTFSIQLVILLLLLWRIRGFRSWVRDTIGERAEIQRPWYRFILPTVFFIPFAFYALLSGVVKTVTPWGFSFIAIAPTLAGIMFTATGSKRISKIVRGEFISVAKKLIVTTVLLMIFASVFFTLDLLGGIDLNSVKWSYLNVFRWAFFWLSAWTFYTGVYLFVLGIADLVLALRHLSR